MNTSEDKIVLTIQRNGEGVIIYDDTESFIDVVHIEDLDLITRIVNSIVRDRLNGINSSTIREEQS